MTCGTGVKYSSSASAATGHNRARVSHRSGGVTMHRMKSTATYHTESAALSSVRHTRPNSAWPTEAGMLSTCMTWAAAHLPAMISSPKMRNGSSSRVARRRTSPAQASGAVAAAPDRKVTYPDRYMKNGMWNSYSIARRYMYQRLPAGIAELWETRCPRTTSRMPRPFAQSRSFLLSDFCIRAASFPPASLYKSVPARPRHLMFNPAAAARRLRRPDYDLYGRRAGERTSRATDAEKSRERPFRAQGLGYTWPTLGSVRPQRISA